MCNPVATIYRAIEYLEAHLQTETTVTKVAEDVGYSLYHFIRTFDRVAQHSPYDYLIRRRLSEAAQALIASDRRITDVSQDYCFENLESFSRAFKRMVGMQPSQWRDQAPQASHPLMPAITLPDLWFMNQAEFRYPQIVEINETPLFGLMTALDQAPQVRITQRRRVLLDLCKIAGDRGPVTLTAVTTTVDPEGKRDYYFMGTERPIDGLRPSAAVMRFLPAGRYVRIPCTEETRDLALRYLHYTWSPQSGLTLPGQIVIDSLRIEKGLPAQSEISLPVNCEGS